MGWVFWLVYDLKVSIIQQFETIRKEARDDSDDEDRSSNVTHVSGDKKAAGNTEKDHNGTSDKSHEKAEPEEPNSAVNESSSPSCSTSRDEITPKRKTGTILKIFNQLCKSDF